VLQIRPDQQALGVSGLMPGPAVSETLHHRMAKRRVGFLWEWPL